MEKEDEIDKVIGKLKKTPLFAMSLGSKELFHSNFWAWIIENDDTNTFLSLFFKNLKNIKHKSMCVDREKYNMDLSIWDREHRIRYVIENKIKAMPDKGQIIGYQSKVKETEFGGGVLTGLIEPIFKMPDSWFFIRYSSIIKPSESSIIKPADSSISECLRGMVKTSNNFSKYEQDTILQYCDMIDNITLLVNNFVTTSGKSLNYDYKKLTEIRFDDLCKKIKANDFVNYLKETIKPEIDEKLIGTGYKADLWSSFSRKDSIIDLRLVKDSGELTEKMIGIQIQGNQYRLHGSRKGFDIKCDDVFEELKNIGWLEEYNTSSKYVFGKKTKMRKNYCKYEGGRGDPYHFVYQYYVIEDFSYDVLTKSISENINKAIDIIKNSKF